MVADDQGSNYGPEISALANCWKAKFAPRLGSGQGREDTHFFYTIPGKTLAPKVTGPKSIKGKSTGVEIADWSEVSKLVEKVVAESCK
jgi:hypothetical protein